MGRSIIEQVNEINLETIFSIENDFWIPLKFNSEKEASLAINFIKDGQTAEHLNNFFIAKKILQVKIPAEPLINWFIFDIVAKQSTTIQTAAQFKQQLLEELNAF